MTEEKRKARRMFVRKNHPDVGGDPETFQKGLEEFEKPEVAPQPPAPVAAVVPAGPPVTDRLARGLGRFAARTAAKAAAIPGEVKDAYKDGRDTDNPL